LGKVEKDSLFVQKPFLQKVTVTFSGLLTPHLILKKKQIEGWKVNPVTS
jgi:hypothetical protein